MEQRLLCILDECIFPPPPSNSDGTNAPLLRAAAEPPFRNCPKTVLVMLPSPGFDSYPAPEKPAQGVGLGGTRVRPVSRHFLISGPYISAAARRSGSARAGSRSATSAPDTMSICIDARRAQSADAAMMRFFSPARDPAGSCPRDGPVRCTRNAQVDAATRLFQGDSLIPLIQGQYFHLETIT